MPRIVRSTAEVTCKHRRPAAPRSSRNRVALTFAVIVLGLPTTHAQDQHAATPIPVPPVHYLEKEMWAPVPNSFPHGLDVLEVYADRPGPHPLALLTHGTASDERERQQVTPWSQLAQALWFAQRGYVSIVVVRKGYGRSGGEPDGRRGGCRPGGTFSEAGEASADDLRDIANWAAQLPEVDTSTIVSAGVSSGGFAQVALSADPPRSLKVAISFAGGRGGDGKEHDCNLDGLIEAFHDFGKSAAKHGGVPMLWIYSQNDHWFPPSQATRFEDAYQKAGGTVRFVLAPSDGEDGHHLFSHVEAWSSTVDDFLRSHSLLPLGDMVLPFPSAPSVPAPPGLSDRGTEAWIRFLTFGPYKAFALSPHGRWGSATGAFNQDIADRDAIDRCKKAAGAGEICRIVARTANAN